MMDQAEKLRMLMNLKKKQMKIVTVTSGKGGVGKSSLALNMGIALNRRGHRALIIDTDFGFSNIDVMLGVRAKYDLMDVIQSRKNIREIIEVGLEGVQFISGGSGIYELTKLESPQLMRIMENVMSLESVSDTIIFDTGAGINDNTLRLIHASHETILVTTPEPTAVVDAYALLKIVDSQGYQPNVNLVLNRVENVREATSVMDGLIRIVEKNTEIPMKKLGMISQDAYMLSAVKEQVPILISHPYCTASADINKLVNSFLNVSVPPRKKPGLAGFFDRFVTKSGMAKE